MKKTMKGLRGDDKRLPIYKSGDQNLPHSLPLQFNVKTSFQY